MKNKYFNKDEYYVDSLWLRHEGIAYRGNGVLTWNPENGFHLVAKVIGETEAIKAEIRSIEVKKPSRMKLEIATRWVKTTVITSPITMTSMDLFFHQKFTVNFNRAVFFHNYVQQDAILEQEWCGSAFLELNKNITFPDSINNDIKLGDRPIRRGFSLTGFDYLGEDEEQVTGVIKDEKYLEFNWSLPKGKWSKNRSWRFAEALQDSISIISGSIAKLRFHETYRSHRVAKEYNSNGDPTSLGLFFQLFDFDIVPKELIARLAFYLSEKSKNEYIIRSMFRQIVDASKQNSEVGRALLLSTVLEASLRTLYDMPFVPGRSSREDPFKAKKVLETFQADYLSGEYDAKWKEKIEEILESYERLRHRAAHPDWVVSEGGMLSSKKMEQTVDDMIALSRFYGYMILSLSGRKDLAPKFPAPFSNWRPIMTMERTPKKAGSGDIQES